jgi:outer membrane protein TolC
MAPYALFSVTDAVFEPLAGRQLVQAREADLRAVTNDTALAVAVAYFDVEQARGDLASAEDVVRRAHELVGIVKKMAPDLVPNLEVTRAEAQLERLDQGVQTAFERWRVSSAELARILRLPPESLLEPVEPAHLQLTLVAPELCVEDLTAVALTYRPELASYQAQVKAALQRWREERLRPLLPILMARGIGTQTPYPMAFGSFGGGQGGSLNNFGLRDDWDLQALWELRNLGFGNKALIKGRRAEHDAAEMQLLRTRDFVAREVVQAYAQVRSASIRMGQAERALEHAMLSVKENYDALGKTKRVGGNINILVIRPQEALAAVQELMLAYSNYYAATADYNRAEFRLYRSLGNPAELLTGPDGFGSCNIPSGPISNCMPADCDAPKQSQKTVQSQ